MFNPEEVAAAARKAARMLGESGAAGRVEKPVLTFNGDVTGKTMLNGMVMISNTVMDLSNVTNVVMISDPTVAEQMGTPSRVEYGKETLTVRKEDGVQYLNNGAVDVAKSVDGAGVFVMCMLGSEIGIEDVEVALYVSLIEFAETIHPIDPKFIPAGVGGGLPVVELTTIVPIDGTQAILTADETAAIQAAAAMNMPCIGRVSIGAPGNAVVIVFSLMPVEENFVAYESYLSSAGKSIVLSVEDGVGAASVMD